MSVNLDLHPRRRTPDPAALLELIKPITWFPPMWAFLCGVVSVGEPFAWPLVLLGLVLAGPVTCGMSQAANDWCDRHVDAINEPHRPIPSGRVPGRWGLVVALAMTLLALAMGSLLGPWGFYATCAAVLAAWAYSAEPIRLKKDGFKGTLLVALSYEGLPWFTGAAIVAQAMPGFPVVLMALLYALGAQGIMVLNDFKAIEGDRAMGIRSIPATKGPEAAARMAVTVMALPQTLVIAMLIVMGRPLHALAVAALLLGQFALMRRFLAAPTERALWYSGVGVPLYVAGMMVTAFAVRGMVL